LQWCPRPGDPAQPVSVLKLIQAEGVAVRTVEQALDEVVPQLA
jgi:hypothetical protein